LGNFNKKVKIYFNSAKVFLPSSFLFPLIHLGVQGRLDEKKRSKEKSSQQKTPARTAGRRLVLWQAPALLAIKIFKGCHYWKFWTF